MTLSTNAIHQRLLAYFRDCLLEDSAERQLADVFAKDEREQYLFPVDCEFWAQNQQIALPADYTARVDAVLQLQPQERELLVGKLMVCGMIDGPQQRRRTLRAPLLLYRAEIVRANGDNRLIIHGDSVRLNPLVMDVLGTEVGAADLSLGEWLTTQQLTHWLQPLQRLEYSAEVPIAVPRRRNQQLCWMASGVVWVTPRSQMARSVAFEIEQLQRDGVTLSAPLQQIFGKPTAPRAIGAAEPDALPVQLTESQGRALHNAAVETLSVINGPPGTGKTYTLASQALDRVMRQETVLIVCGNEHAADVVRAKLGELFGCAQDLIVRAGRASYQQELLQQLESLLSGGAARRKTLRVDLAHSELRSVTRRYRRNLRQFNRGLTQAVEQGVRWRSGMGSLHQRFWRFWVTRQLQQRPLLSEQWKTLAGDAKAQQQAAQHYLRALAEQSRSILLQHKRQQLAALASAMRARASGTREARFQQLDWQVLTQLFPVWVVSAQALHRALPLQAELFSLVIVDEATQCNLPLALPALQRAARAVIVGDPKQLRHYSFLARARQQVLAERHQLQKIPFDLDYRSRSLLDYGLAGVSNDSAITLLDEHFRSRPTLIAFSNQYFYQNRLKILTRETIAAGGVSPSSGAPVRWVECDTLLANEVNEAELDAVMACLQRLIERFSTVPEHECPSLGVVAFFRATAIALERRVLQQLDLRTLSRHGLRVGTPYAFQGEERDIIVMATGLYPGRAPAAWTYLNRADVFNVAVTRARQQMYWVMARGVIESAPAGLMQDYLAFMRQPVPNAPKHNAGLADPQQDAMLGDLVSTLQSWGVKCQEDYPFAGQNLDVLALKDTHALAIDLIGSATHSGAAWEWERYRLLERAGLELFPIAYLEWLHRREEILHRLRCTLGVDTELEADRDQQALLSLKWRITELEDSDLQQLLTDLGHAHQQALHWLGQRFASGELTFGRFYDAIERLRHAALVELQGICVLLEGVKTFQAETYSADLQVDVQARLKGCRAAIERLRGLAAELASLRTSDSGLEDALEELTRLTARVHQYDLAAK